MPERTHPRQLKRAKSDAELEKLRLESEHLKNKSKWNDRIAPYINLLTIIIAVGGFVFSFYQFNRTHELATAREEKEQDIRIQQQIYSDMTQLLQIPKDPQAPTAKALFLLEDLKYYISLKYKKKQDDPKDTAANATRNATLAFVYSMRNDCDFNQSQDVNFIIALIKYWDDLDLYLKTHAEDNYEIQDKYSDALRQIYLKDSAFVTRITIRQDTGFYDYPDETKLQLAEIDHTILLIDGFQYNFELNPNEEFKTNAALEFQWATCNQTLTKDLLGISFDPKDKPDLKHCLGK